MMGQVSLRKSCTVLAQGFQLRLWVLLLNVKDRLSAHKPVLGRATRPTVRCGTLLAHYGYLTKDRSPSRTRSHRQTQGASVQLSMFNLGTRPNSRMLFVTSVTPRLRAWAAMNRSFA